MDWISEFTAIGRVLLVGLILGAGLPALFAVGLRLYSTGPSDGQLSPADRGVRLLGLAIFATIVAIILIAIAWITRDSIDHYFGIDLFPFDWAK